jgi:hypothetical protein
MCRLSALRQDTTAIIKYAGAIRPAYFLKSLDVPKADWAQILRPGLASGEVELMAQIVFEIVAVIDDVGLVDRENRISLEARVVRHHAVCIDRNELWRG